MLLSMTGFGKSVVENDGHKVTVEIKSLNSKQLDMSVKLPAAYREVELDLRARIARRLERGKVDVIVTVGTVEGSTTLSLNMPALRRYKEQIEEMSSSLGLPEPADWYATLLRMPDAFSAESAEDTGADTDLLFAAVDEAVESLMQFRASEGVKLEEFFTTRIDTIERLLSEVPRYETERVTKIRARIQEGLDKMALGTLDPARLEQEMIFYIEKLDINEEKQRLGQHLRYFMETMNGTYGQGKKLGFISQEMGREINTLGSKSNHAQMQRLVVKMKDELEQIKEQVLNVM